MTKSKKVKIQKIQKTLFMPKFGKKGIFLEKRADSF